MMQVNLTELQQDLERRLPQALALLEEMVAINSFTANREGVNQLGDMTAGVFAGLGFTSSVVPAHSAELGDHLVLERSGRAGAQAPTVAMVSHLDTEIPAEDEIRNNFCWRPEGERIYGPGTCDIKGGTVMIYLVLSAMQALYPEAFEATRWIVLLNAAEEILDPAFGQLTRSVIPADALACLVFESGRVVGDQFSVVAARKGMATYRIETEGKAAHAGSNHKGGANAITQMARIVDAVAALTDYERDLTFNIGAIEGGTVSNRVPHSATAYGEMRAYTPSVLAEGIGRLLELQNSSSVQNHKGDFACQVRVEIEDQWGPWPSNAASDALLAHWQQAGQEMGVEALREERGGLSDGNFTWDYVPTLDGLGVSGGNAHCSERSADGKKEQEYLDYPAILPKATLNTLAILRLLEAHREGAAMAGRQPEVS
jgi:glutamate carboxypeptidase